MQNYYSIERNGFYSDSRRAEHEASAAGWPSDAIPVDETEELAIRAAVARKDSVGRVDGAWSFTPYVPSAEELIAAAERDKATALALAAQQIAILTEATDPDVVDEPSAADAALLLLWKKYRQALRVVVVTASAIDWPTQPDFPSGM